VDVGDIAREKEFDAATEYMDHVAAKLPDLRMYIVVEHTLVIRACVYLDITCVCTCVYASCACVDVCVSNAFCVY
jgi:hypothetical protein